MTNKTFHTNLTLFTALCLLMTSCEKNELRLQETTDPSTGAYFKLGWFSPGLNSQGVQLKINNVRQSNQLGFGFTATSTTAGYAMPFPGGGLNTGGNNKNDYLAVPTGDIEVKLSVPKRGTNEDSITVLTTTMTVETGKYYSLMVTDSFPAAQSYVLNDDVAYADSGSIKLRFTNAIPNVGGPVDFLRSNTTTGINQVVASNINYKAASDFITMPVVVGTDTIKVRRSGTTAFLATYSTGSLSNRRVFTVVGRGYISATAVRAPSISIIYNR